MKYNIINKIRSARSIVSKPKKILFGNRIPKDFFVTSGTGQSDITVHAGSFHLALKDAGIESYNIMSYSSIMPAIATQIEKPKELPHGCVLETIMACANADQGHRATAGIIIGWLYDKETGEGYGGLVAEYSEGGTEEHAKEILRKSLDELYLNGFSEKFELRDIQTMVRSFVPEKKHGSALVALCFTSYEHPIIN